MYFMTSIVIVKNTTFLSEFIFNSNGSFVDVLKVFAFNPNYATTTKLFETNFITIINSIQYDLSQLLVAYSPYLTTPPFSTNFDTIINGTTYDISQVFILYPIEIISGSVQVYYTSGISYYAVVSNTSTTTNLTSSFNFINSPGTITGYIVGGGGGGAPGADIPDDRKGGCGGGAGATYYLNGIEPGTNQITITCGAGGPGADPNSGTQTFINGKNSTLTVNSTAYKANAGFSGQRTYPANNPTVPGGAQINGGQNPGGNGGSGGEGADQPGISSQGTTPGGGGGGTSVNGININYLLGQNGSNGGNGIENVSPGASGSFNGGIGGGNAINDLPVNGVYGAGGGGGLSGGEPFISQPGANGGGGLAVVIFTV